MGFASVGFVLVVTVAAVVVGMPVDTFQPVSYLGWKVLEVHLAEAAQGAEPGTPAVNLDDFDDTTTMSILNQNRRTGVAEVAVSPEALNDVTAHLTQHKVPFTTKLEDLGRKIMAVEPILRVDSDLNGGVTFNRYMNYDEIEAYVRKLPTLHPTKVKVETAGKSRDGRTIHLITVTDDVANKDMLRKRSIFIDGGIHAREWISPATTLGIVENLLKTPELTRNIEWRIIPVVNPDGYVRTWNGARLWRKNTVKGNSPSCSGVDLNRNFGHEWGGKGSSRRQCSNIYRGPHAFSEPEAQAVRDAVLREADRTKAYITFHSYGQMILHAWGYTAKVLPPNNAELERVGHAMAAAIEKQQLKKYDVGSAAGVLYAAAGGSDDWAAGVAKVPLSYTIELRDTGYGGFLLPASEIVPTVQDAWLAMKVLANEVSKLAVPRGEYPDFPQQEGFEETEVTQEEVFQPPPRANQEPEGGNAEVQGEGIEPTNENQGNQEAVNRNHETMNQNQEGSQVPVNVNQEPLNENQGSHAAVNRNQEPVNQNQGNQEAVNRNQETVNENQEGSQVAVNVNQEPLNENQGSHAAVNRNQEPVNQNQEGSQVPVNRNQEPVNQNQEGSQVPVNRNQEPVNQNQGSQVPVNENQEPLTENQGGQAAVNRNQEPVNENHESQIATDNNQEPAYENQESQVAVNRHQEQEPDPQELKDTQQASAETSEMETEEAQDENSSLETLRIENQPPPQFYSHLRFNPHLRDASEPLNDAPRSPETQSSFRHAPGGSVHLKTLCEDLSTSSEEDANESSE